MPNTAGLERQTMIYVPGPRKAGYNPLIKPVNTLQTTKQNESDAIY
jgi:hypothetical protein